MKGIFRRLPFNGPVRVVASVIILWFSQIERAGA